MDEYLWPARNIAEYAYCPRLFYLMEVEGIHISSADTEKGQAVHRRVNAPSTDSGVASDPDRPRAVRSLALTSSTLGLTATLDLAEIEDGCAIPVEYRKGRPYHPLPAAMNEEDDRGENVAPAATPLQPWPTDRVQVALQAILLEEHGYTVPAAVLYYAAEKRRLRIPVDDALKREALDTLHAAQAAAKGQRPLPLVNDPRCRGCSLQPFCLPDEIQQQRHEQTVSARKLWPPRDDGIHLVAQIEGTRIGVRGEALRLTDKDGKLVKEFPLAGVESLSILGHVQLSTQALHVLADHNIPVAFLSTVGRLVALVDVHDQVSAAVRRAQVKRFEEPETRLELTRALLAAKISNQRTLLLRNHPSLPSRLADDLADQADRALRADTVDAARGHEGQAAALYFANLGGMIKGPAGLAFDATGRKRRPPPDPVNACLSFAYSMLTHECVTALRLASLEPTIGAFHVSRPGRPALALDLMEPFRPLIADSIALAAFNRNELTEGHILRTSAGCAFTDAGRRAFFNAYGRRMEQEVTHPVFGYKLSYRRMLTLHARLIAAWLLGELPALAFLTTR